MSDICQWSPENSGNTDPQPDGFPEDIWFSHVNESTRELMAAFRRAQQQISHAFPATLRFVGDQEAECYKVTPAVDPGASVPDGYGIVISPDATNTRASVPLQVGSATPLPIVIYSDLGLIAGGMLAGRPYSLIKRTDSEGLEHFQLINPSYTDQTAASGSWLRSYYPLDASRVTLASTVPLDAIPDVMTGKNADSVDGLHVIEENDDSTDSIQARDIDIQYPLANKFVNTQESVNVVFGRRPKLFVFTFSPLGPCSLAVSNNFTAADETLVLEDIIDSQAGDTYNDDDLHNIIARGQADLPINPTNLDNSLNVAGSIAPQKSDLDKVLMLDGFWKQGQRRHDNARTGDANLELQRTSCPIFADDRHRIFVNAVTTLNGVSQPGNWVQAITSVDDANGTAREVGLSLSTPYTLDETRRFVLRVAAPESYYGEFASYSVNINVIILFKETPKDPTTSYQTTISTSLFV